VCFTCPVAQAITDPSGTPTSDSETTLPISQVVPANNATVIVKLINLLRNPTNATAVRRMQGLEAGVLSETTVPTQSSV